MRKVGFALLGVALLLLIGRIALGLLRQPDDRTLVREAIEEATLAAREGRSGVVLNSLSDRFSANGQTANNRDIANTIRRLRPDLKFNAITPVVTGDEARVTSAATLEFGILNQRKTLDLPSITVVLAKEPDRDFLIIPTHRWRVTSLEVPDETVQAVAPSIIMGGF